MEYVEDKLNIPVHGLVDDAKHHLEHCTHSLPVTQPHAPQSFVVRIRPWQRTAYDAVSNETAEEPTSEKYHSLVESKSLTLLVDQPEEHVDETLAESIIDSMHTCVDTITLEDDALPVDNNSHENTLNVPGMDSDEENDEYMAEMLPHDNVKERESTPTV